MASLALHQHCISAHGTGKRTDTGKVEVEAQERSEQELWPEPENRAITEGRIKQRGNYRDRDR